MMDIHINYVAVLIAAVVSFVLGGIWYSPALFGARWMRAIGKSEAQLKQGNVALAYVGAFAAALMMAFVLALFIGFAQAKTVLQGAEIALWAWVGFVGAPTLSNYLFSGWPRDLYFINNGYYLVSLLLMGGLLAVWT
jgi:hypothetical protein